jgi:hypothetical protein
MPPPPGHRTEVGREFFCASCTAASGNPTTKKPGSPELTPTHLLPTYGPQHGSYAAELGAHRGFGDNVRTPTLSLPTRHG